MFDYSDSVEERWQSIYAFVSTWTDITFKPNLSTDLKSLENKLNVKLPYSVKEWIFFINSCNIENSNFNLRDHLNIDWMKDFDSLSILLQGESDLYWSIKKEHLKMDDPPVTAYFLDYEKPKEEFLEQGEWSPSVSCFALDYFLSYFNSNGGFFASTIQDEYLKEMMKDFNYETMFGSLKIFHSENKIAFTNLNEENWNFNEIKCMFKNKVRSNEFSPIFNKIYSKATLIGGSFE